MIQLSLFDIEYWKPVPGFGDRYEASSLGRVRRIPDRRDKSFWRDPLLKPTPSKAGYLMVQAWYGKRMHTTGVHQLVAAAFIGPCPDEMEVNHIDLDKANNRPENLEYLTHIENLKHAKKNGGWSDVPRGERAARSKLTEVDVRQIRLLLADGHSHRKIAKAYGVSQVAITCINTGKTWSHVK